MVSGTAAGARARPGRCVPSRASRRTPAPVAPAARRRLRGLPHRSPAVRRRSGDARRRPIVPGHQIVGRVEAVGHGGRRLARAAIAPASPGWRAPTAPATSAAPAARTCASAPPSPAGTSTAAMRRTRSRAPTSPCGSRRLRRLAAAPLLCGGVIGYRSLKRSGVEPGGRLGLYGFGASALITLQVARHWGCRVFVATRSAAEQEHARVAGGGVGRRLRRPAARAAGRARSRSRPRATWSAPRCAPSIAARPWRSTPSTSIACPRCLTRSSGGSAGWRASRTSRAPTPAESSTLRRACGTTFETHRSTTQRRAGAAVSRRGPRSALAVASRSRRRRGVDCCGLAALSPARERLRRMPGRIWPTVARS